MEIKVIESSKDEIELEIENLTIAEILRVYLSKDANVSFTAWRREHPTKRPLLIIKTKGKTAKKAVDDAVSAIAKDLDNLDSEFKKLK